MTSSSMFIVHSSDAGLLRVSCACEPRGVVEVRVGQMLKMALTPSALQRLVPGVRSSALHMKGVKLTGMTPAAHFEWRVFRRGMQAGRG